MKKGKEFFFMFGALLVLFVIFNVALGPYYSTLSVLGGILAGVLYGFLRWNRGVFE